MDGQVFVVKVEDIYADVLRLQAENAELRKRLEWQPMETCPQGKRVLLKHVTGAIGIYEYYGNGVNSVYIGWKEVE